MINPDLRFIFVVSTAGSVMNQVLKSQVVRQVTYSVVADQPCQAVEKANSFGLPTVVFDEGSNEAFCTRLHEYLVEHKIDYILSFYTQFYTQELRSAYQDRIVNFHPSLLPAFKGMDGFGDGVAYHTKIIGTTVELIKDVMDEGKIVMQTACTVDPNQPKEFLRHRIFVQQCKTLIQVVSWLIQGRVLVDGDRITIEQARYHDLEFVPALEIPDAIDLQIPYPG
ncbi:MAG: formyltransferase family protein [Chloroflexota bacterium]